MKKTSLHKKFPPSSPCSCDICVNYCRRPGWWTVEEADRAIKAGMGERIMLEVSPEMTFAVLSPAFKDNECSFAYNEFSKNKCLFLKNNQCELFGTGLIPLECRFCHHERTGWGEECHNALERDWNTEAGQKIIDKWIERINFDKKDMYYSLINRRIK